MKIEDVGDTEFLIDEQVDKFRFGKNAVRADGDFECPVGASRADVAGYWPPPWSGAEAD